MPHPVLWVNYDRRGCLDAGGGGAGVIIGHAMHSDADDLMMPAGPFVYFVEAVGTDQVKIGFTADPLRRLLTLATGSPHKLRLRRLMEGSTADEAALHRLFRNSRRRGEWFKITPALSRLLSEAERPERQIMAFIQSRLCESIMEPEDYHHLVEEHRRRSAFGAAMANRMVALCNEQHGTRWEAPFPDAPDAR